MRLLSEPDLVVAVIEVVAGVLLLGKAADTFVEGAANLAGSARVSPVLVGAVIVGFGTSAPELLVSGIAAVNGDLDLGVGNIVGSNVANLTLVLGSASLIVPVLVTRPVLIREAPLSLLSVLLFAYLAHDGLARWEGLLLLVALVLSLGWVIAGGVGDATQARAGTSPQADPNPRDVASGLVDDIGADPATGAACGTVGNGVANGATTVRGASTHGSSSPAGGRGIDTTSGATPANGPGEGAGADGGDVAAMVNVAQGPILAELGLTLAGLIGTVVGAQLLVWGATGLASSAGLSGGFVGFTLVAVGTSLPELVTAVAAARRRATELLLGNLLGSNLFNGLAVGGAIAVVGPGQIADRGLATVGMLVMVLVALGAWASMVTLKRVHRVEGGLLLASWVIAVVLLARTATEDALASIGL